MRLLSFFFFFWSPCRVEQSGTTIAPSSTADLWPFQMHCIYPRIHHGIASCWYTVVLSQKWTVGILFGRHILGCWGKHFAALRQHRAHCEVVAVLYPLAHVSIRHATTALRCTLTDTVGPTGPLVLQCTPNENNDDLRRARKEGDGSELNIW